MKIAWASDIHLDFVNPERRKSFYSRIKSWGPDILLLTGDNSTSLHLYEHIEELRSETCPVWFVNGNHDYYHGSISEVRVQCWERYTDPANILYLPSSPPLELSPGVFLIGEDGWYDGRNGEYEKSNLMMSDFQIIQEFAWKNRKDRLKLMQDLSDASARTVVNKIQHCLSGRDVKEIVIATHVPPFKEAAWHLGKMSSSVFLPFFSSKAMGQSIMECTRQFRQNGGKVRILCGHSHSIGKIEWDGMECITAESEYGSPQVSDYFEYE